MEVTIDPNLRQRLHGLKVVMGKVEGVTVQKNTSELEEFKKKMAEEVKRKYSIETLKDVPVIRAYRDFFWEVGIDPTKIRPASEALIRRILRGRSLPVINTLVDVYNLASISSHIAIGVFDFDRVDGDLLIRQAVAGEPFLGIGMKDSIYLSGKEVVVRDEKKLIAIYPYRDSDATKVTLDTTNVLILMCGVPNVTKDVLTESLDLTAGYITRFCGGKRSS